jgi:preprotein translocase subunit SecA
VKLTSWTSDLGSKLLNWPPDDDLVTRRAAESQKVLQWGHQIAAQVGALGPEMQSRTDDELRGLTGLSRARLDRGESLDELLPEAFAAVREAAARTLGHRHLDVQVIGGAVLHRGMVAEMRAGEGKTLTVALAAYLNALPGTGVHVLTASDYLAARDAGRLGSLYRFLGLSTGLVTAGPDHTPEKRRPEYEADVTYGDWRQFAIDYLYDNMSWDTEELVQRGHPFAIIDDADRILIDDMELTPELSGEGQTLARVQAWDYLGQYRRRAGIAGTAVTDARTYQRMYCLDVVAVPPDKPVIRVDHPAGEYRTRLARLTALADQTGRRHAAGQPVLIATESPEESATVSGLLAERDISHEALTTADDEREAQLIAGAGRRGRSPLSPGRPGRERASAWAARMAPDTTRSPTWAACASWVQCGPPALAPNSNCATVLAARETQERPNFSGPTKTTSSRACWIRDWRHSFPGTPASTAACRLARPRLLGPARRHRPSQN